MAYPGRIGHLVEELRGARGTNASESVLVLPLTPMLVNVNVPTLPESVRTVTFAAWAAELRLSAATARAVRKKLRRIRNLLDQDA